MTDDVLDRFTRPLLRPPGLSSGEAADPEREGLTDYGAFGWLRGVRERAVMLELRRRDGNIRALGYAWLQQADFDPSVGIVLQFGAARVRLIGRNLNAELRPNVRLFQGLIRQRVPYIQEADEPTLMEAPDQATIIERIEW